jgi:hypothetical protein
MHRSLQLADVLPSRKRVAGAIEAFSEDARSFSTKLSSSILALRRAVEAGGMADGEGWGAWEKSL